MKVLFEYLVRGAMFFTCRFPRVPCEAILEFRKLDIETAIAAESYIGTWTAVWTDGLSWQDHPKGTCLRNAMPVSEVIAVMALSDG